MDTFFNYNKAIARRPSRDVCNGLRTVDSENPSYEIVKAEHAAYVEALIREGVDVEVLDPLLGFPDALFVEDPAIVFSDAAIVLRSSMPERRGESETLARALDNKFCNMFYLEHGFVDGGDILQLPDAVIIGLSQRTNREGAEALGAILKRLDKKSFICDSPKEVLHLKSDCSLIDFETILVTERLANEEIFKDLNKILVPLTELSAANAIRIKSKIFIGEQFSETIQILEKLQYVLVPLPTTEISKIDAGLSCMSLRWRG